MPLLGQDPVSTPNETTDLTDLCKATGVVMELGMIIHQMKG